MRRMLVASLTTLSLASCTGSAEQPIVEQLFNASRLHDTTTLNGFSMVEIDPLTQGSVLSFSITSVSRESHTPLMLESLARAYEEANAADAAFTRRHDEYARQHAESVTRVAKAGRDVKLTGADADVQAAWFRLVDEGRDLSRKVAEAKRRLANESAVVQLSVADPRHPIEVATFDGEIASKQVTVDANVRRPDGTSTRKTYIVTLQRAIVKGQQGDINGRWIISDVKDASASGGATTS